MSRLSDSELANLLHSRRHEAKCVPHLPFPGARVNFCRDNAEACVLEHQSCKLVRGWLIEEFATWNYFIAHVVVQHPNGSLTDPTPMRGQHRFIPHDGGEEDFALQSLNRPQVQYPPLDVFNWNAVNNPGFSSATEETQ
jgi:hypothetical protein